MTCFVDVNVFGMPVWIGGCVGHSLPLVVPLPGVVPAWPPDDVPLDGAVVEVAGVLDGTAEPGVADGVGVDDVDLVDVD